MGDIADMMIEGSLCCQCGSALDERVIEQELGFPVICDDCYGELSKREKAEYKDRREGIFIQDANAHFTRFRKKNNK